MNKLDDYRLKDFIVNSEKLLESLDDFEEFANVTESGMAEKISDVMHETSIETIKESVNLQFDGYAKVRIVEEGMKVLADFYPPTGTMAPIEPDTLAQLLSEKSISVGVDWDSIHETIFQCNTERIKITDVVIARGERPIFEEPEHWIIEELLKEPVRSFESDNSRMDFREINHFVLVKEGQVLARQISKKSGKTGTTVLGKSIPHGQLNIPDIKPGINTRVEGMSIVADCDGRFMYDASSFRVHKVLEIAGDIDYSTGHIDFPGDVIINGVIKDGFKVHSGGNIICTRTLNASEVSSGKDLIVNQGIIGRNKGKVKVGGEVKTKFIENCYLEAEGSVFVENGILNSDIHSLKLVELTRKGTVIGGTIHALDGVTAVQIGSAHGPRTEIYCGIDYSVKQKLMWIRDKNIELISKQNQIEIKLKTATTDKEKLLEMEKRVKQGVQKMNEAANSLVFQLNKNEAAEVVVKGYIFPGTYIEICHVSYVVPMKMTNVRFKLDKLKGKVIAESLVNGRVLRNE